MYGPRSSFVDSEQVRQIICLIESQAVLPLLIIEAPLNSLFLLWRKRPARSFSKLHPVGDSSGRCHVQMLATTGHLFVPKPGAQHSRCLACLFPGLSVLLASKEAGGLGI